MSKAIHLIFAVSTAGVWFSTIERAIDSFGWPPFWSAVAFCAESLCAVYIGFLIYRGAEA